MGATATGRAVVRAELRERAEWRVAGSLSLDIEEIENWANDDMRRTIAARELAPSLVGKTIAIPAMRGAAPVEMFATVIGCHPGSSWLTIRYAGSGTVTGYPATAFLPDGIGRVL
jgi:hypothetical protein